MKYKVPRGTRDILGSDMLVWNRVNDAIAKITALNNYQKIETPIFEQTDLFKRGVGENTDIVEKEMYTFEDKSQRSLTLRPEGTASVVRAFVENKLYGGRLPIKLFYNGPMFRYEKAQKGRYRQFYQFGIEALGSGDPGLDAEVISVGWQLLMDVGIDSEEVKVHINSVGCKECREKYKEKLIEYYQDKTESLCSNCKTRLDKNPLRLLDCKNESCGAMANKAPSIFDVICTSCDEHFSSVKRYLEVFNVPYVLDKRLVRGLDYYTHTAFEYRNQKATSTQDAFGGGGRYNGLVEELGGPQTPAIGLAMGVDRIVLALLEKQLPQEHLNFFVVSMGEEEVQRYATEVMQMIRQHGYSCDKDYGGRSFKAQMRLADKCNAEKAVIIGDEEMKNKTLTLKNLKEGKQEILLEKQLKQQLERGSLSV
ncbi:histidine--tRNA ligase [Proteinivorax hydrogeniformans]|uniref:Histidine--tRNA ligase n=1 Tax=Proteinivorax hydrogeniformans TaxID=1826727 RepID=A0AAU8HS89_9FIRM